MVFMLIEIVPFSFDCCYRSACSARRGAPSVGQCHTYTRIPKMKGYHFIIYFFFHSFVCVLVNAERVQASQFLYMKHERRCHFTTPSTFIGYWMRLNVLSCAVKMDFNYMGLFQHWCVCAARAVSLCVCVWGGCNISCLEDHAAAAASHDIHSWN